MSAGPGAVGRTPLGVAGAHGTGAFDAITTVFSGTPATRRSPTGRQTRWSCTLRRMLPQRPLVLVGDNSYAVLDLLHCCQSLREPVTLIARLRLDAVPVRTGARVPSSRVRHGRPAIERSAYDPRLENTP